MSAVQLALRLAERGWCVLPCEPHSKAPVGALVPRGHMDATADPAVIRAWWTVRPDARPAISLEPSGLVALDVDVKDEGWRASYAELEPQLAPTTQQATPSGGAHALYRRTESGQARRIIRWKPGIDLLGRGYVLAYGETLLECEPAPLPAALSAAFAARPAIERAGSHSEVDIEPATWELLQYAHRLAIAHGPKAKGQGGNQHAYQLGAILLHDLALTPEEAKPIILAWKNAFPETRGWRDEYLLETVEHAARYASGPRGTGRLDLAVLRACGMNPAQLEIAAPTSAADGGGSGTPSPFAPAAPAPETPTTWYDPAAAVALIRSRADEPWLPIGVADRQVDEVRAGGTVTLQGPTGAGKTSLVAEMLLYHCRAGGHSLVLSAELTADEFFARIVGIELGRYWKAVLRGEVSDQDMLDALPRRLLVADGAGATLEALDSALGVLRAAVGPREPILVAADYGQILDAPGEAVRDRVSGVWRGLNDIGRRHRAAVLVLSQMSRAASKAARAGERLGAEAVDGGAETAAIERWSTLVLEIGPAGEENTEGMREVSLSIAKGRMSGGDLVLPMTYEGRTGRWRVTGDARPATEVKAELKEKLATEVAQRDDQAVYAAVREAHERGEYKSKEGWRTSNVSGPHGKVSATRIVASLERLAAGDKPRLRTEPMRHPKGICEMYLPSYVQPRQPAPLDPNSIAARFVR